MIDIREHGGIFGDSKIKIAGETEIEGVYMEDIEQFDPVYGQIEFTEIDNPDADDRPLIFSKDGLYAISVPLGDQPHNIYKNVNGELVRVSSLDFKYNIHRICFSKNNEYIAFTHNDTYKGISLAKKSGDSYYYLPNISELSTVGIIYKVAFSNDGKFLAVPTTDAPYLFIYRIDGEQFQKVPNPDIMPTLAGRTVAFSNDSRFLVIGHNRKLTVYENIDDEFIKIPDALVQPASSVYDLDIFGECLAYVGYTNDPFGVYKLNDEGIEKLPQEVIDEGISPTIGVEEVAFSTDGEHLLVGNSTGSSIGNLIYLYKRNGFRFYRKQDFLYRTSNRRGRHLSMNKFFTGYEVNSIFKLYKNSMPKVFKNTGGIPDNRDYFAGYAKNKGNKNDVKTVIKLF